MGIREIRETTESCKHCFMCRHACPTFLATKLDSHTPRGYALLLSEIDHGYQSWTRSIVDRFYQCSMCGLCREDCAYHWAEDEVVRNAREEIVNSSLAPDRVKAVASSITVNQSPYGEAPPAWIPTSCTPGRKNVEILYFAGCSTRHAHPEILHAVEKIMGALGADWTVMRDEGCCGVPLFELGYGKDAREMSQRLAEKVQELKPRILLTGCAHCFRAFRELYPSWGSTFQKNLQVMHISQYLLSQVRQGFLKRRPKNGITKASYHDPCQLGRKMGEFDAPRELIDFALGAPPLELFHGREKAECCGAGSSMFLTDPFLTRKVARLRLERVREIESTTVITACQNCKSAFLSTLDGQDSGIRVLDIVELMAMAISE